MLVILFNYVLVDEMFDGLGFEEEQIEQGRSTSSPMQCSTCEASRRRQRPSR